MSAEPQITLQLQEPKPQQPEQRHTYETEDPWWQASQDRRNRSQEVHPATSRPELVAPLRVPQDAGANPQGPESVGSIHESVAPQSPFIDGAEPFHPRNVRPSGFMGGAHPVVSGYAGGRLCISVPSKKDNKN